MDPLTFSLFWVFGWVILLLVAWHLKGQRRQRRLELAHKERMMAMEKGVPLPELPEYDDPQRRPLLAEVVGQVRVNPRWPLGLGAVSVMLGLGICAAFWLSQDDLHGIWSIGLIAVFFGLGLILYYPLTHPSQGRS
jgi:Domain of unknown function (DUF6249)